MIKNASKAKEGKSAVKNTKYLFVMLVTIVSVMLPRVKVTGAMSLPHGMWYDLWNRIIMRTVLYTTLQTHSLKLNLFRRVILHILYSAGHATCLSPRAFHHALYPQRN